MVFLGSVKGRPDRLPLEEAHGMNEALLVAGEAMVNALGERHEVAGLDVDADPLVIQITNVKVT